MARDRAESLSMVAVGSLDIGPPIMILMIRFGST
jgi:hypothetical protein